MHDYVDRRAGKELRSTSTSAVSNRLLAYVIHTQAEAVDELSRIQEDAEQSPTEASIEVARRLLMAASVLSLPAARVLPLADGGIMIRFWKGNRFASVDVFDDGDVIGTAAARGSGEPAQVWQVAAGADHAPVSDDAILGLLRRFIDQLG